MGPSDWDCQYFMECLGVWDAIGWKVCQNNQISNCPKIVPGSVHRVNDIDDPVWGQSPQLGVVAPMGQQPQAAGVEIGDDDGKGAALNNIHLILDYWIKQWRYVHPHLQTLQHVVSVQVEQGWELFIVQGCLQAAPKFLTTQCMD